MFEKRCIVIGRRMCVISKYEYFWDRQLLQLSAVNVIFRYSHIVIISEEKWRVFWTVVTKRPKVQGRKKCGVKRSEVQWSEMKWCEVKWREVKWSLVKCSEVKWSEMKWCEVQWSEMKWCEVKCSEVKWSDVKWIELNWWSLVKCMYYNLFIHM
jgi:hypothetical protein